MAPYFVEYEFKTTGGDVYWFPLRINADSQMKAEIISTAVESAINENHHVSRKSEPVLIIEDLNSDFIRDYTELRMRGKIKYLEMRLFQFQDIEGNANLNFGQHIDLLSRNPELIYEHTIATNIENIKLPLRQITNNLKDYDEFLLINVVKPDNLEK